MSADIHTVHVPPVPDATAAEPVEEPPAPEAASRKARTAAVLATPVEPLLIPFADVPAALAFSRAHLARLRVAGKFGPAVLRSGRKLLVRRDELERWIQAGMPDAATWRAMEAAAGRRAARVVG
jgi:hypothetical protein